MNSKRLAAAALLACVMGACTTSGGQDRDFGAAEPFRIALQEARRTPVPADDPDVRTYLSAQRMLSTQYIRVVPPTELREAAIKALKGAGNSPPEAGKRRLIEAAVGGMVAHLGDEEASVIAGEEYLVLRGKSRNAASIGIEMRKDPASGSLRVVAPIEGAPAERAGVRKDDIIDAIDGQPTAALTLPRAATLLRGPDGSTATLTVRRAGHQAPLTMKVQRAPVRIDPVKHRMHDGVAVVRIVTFSASTAERLDAALADLRQQAGGRLDKVVIDLRRNTGGLVDGVVEVASRLIGPATVFTALGRPGRDNRVARGVESVKGAAMVVLIDHDTLMGGEMLAAAIQDHQRALLFGERTPGKAKIATIASIGDATDDLAIRIPTATVLRPSGGAIDCNGVLPDLEIGRTPPNAGPACPSPATPPKVRYDAVKLCPAVAASTAGRDDPALDCAVEALRDTLAATSPW